MITRFTEYIVESRKSIEELEMLNPFELGKLLIAEVREVSPDIKYIQNLLDVGCPINHIDPTGRNALHHAVFGGKLDAVKLLVSNGVGVNVKDGNGDTPLHKAAKSGYLEIMKLLVSVGGDVNSKADIGWAPLHFAAMNGHLEVAKFLISSGADIHIGDNDLGWTAWDVAIDSITTELPELNPNK